MGLFANTLFSVLLGWVQTAASWLWSLLTDTDVHAWIRWVLDHWLALVILLCLAGVAVDFIVYLFRWQPYRMWGRFLKRSSEPEEEQAPEVGLQQMLQRKWLYADGSTEVENVPAAQPLQTQEPSERLSAPIRPVRRAVRWEDADQAYHQPVYPPQWQREPRDERGGNE